MQLIYWGRDFAWIYEPQDQISFLDGHVRAFAHLDGVPARREMCSAPSPVLSAAERAKW
jgi:hypothetical protein